MSVDLRGLVRGERRRRGLSIRGAAALGEISNTTWSDWEAGKRDELGVMQHAVSKAFGWPVDWPTNPEPDESPPGIGLPHLSPETQQALEKVTEAIRGMAAIQAALETMQTQVASAVDRLDRVEQQVARIVPRPRRSGQTNG